MKPTTVRIAAALAVIAAAPTAARAQTDTTANRADPPAAASTRPLAVGDALRVTAADQPPFTGTLKRITADSLVLVAPYRIYRLPRASVTAGERAVFAESRGHAIFRGVRVGALGGAALGLLGAVLMTKDPGGRAFITADGVALGALVGSALGVRSRRPRWERVDPSLLAPPAELPAPAPPPAGTQP